MTARRFRFGKRVKASVALGVAALCLAGAVLWLMRAESSFSPGSPRTADEARGILSRLPGFGSFAEGTIQQRDLIASIEVEKAEMCPGDDVRIAVRIDPARERVGFRSEASVQGLPSGAAVLRFGSPGKRNFFVAVTDGDQGLDFRTGSVMVLPPKHPKCVNKPRLVLYARAIQEETYRFEIIDAPNVTADAYRWEFGDGIVTETKVRFVEHSFLGRVQDRPRSVFHVRVTALSGSRDVAQARHSVIFANTYFATVEAGSPQVPAEYSQRLQRSAGAYETQVDFANPDQNPIRMQNARLTLHPCDGSGMREVEVPAASVLSKTELKPGAQSVGLRVSVPGTELCGLQVHLEGDTVPPREGSRLPGGQGTIAKTTTVLSFTMQPQDKKQAEALQRAIEREKRLLLQGDEEPVPEGAEGKAKPKGADEDGPEPEAVTP